MSTKTDEHAWTEVAFSWGGWIECRCGFRPESQEEMDEHITPPSVAKQANSTTEPDWHSPHRYLPADGDKVLAMDSGGHVQTLLYDKGMWWLPDRSMYVYYTPTFWRDPS